MSEIRRAFICEQKQHVEERCMRRIFLLPDEPDFVPKCPDHPTRSMVLQANVPYPEKPPAPV